MQDFADRGLFGIKGKVVFTTYQAHGLALRKETPEAILASMYDLDGLTEEERGLMSIFAVLPAERVTFDWLDRLIPSDLLEDCLTALARRGWLDLQPNPASFRVSPVVQEVVRHRQAGRLYVDAETLIDALISNMEFEGGIGHPKKISYADATYLAALGKPWSKNSKLWEKSRDPM
ncbi:MAG: hypothetical protein U0176_24305 [Bacteroidia bacterium]